VVCAAKGGPRKEQQQQHQQQALQRTEAYYLVGPWDQVVIDPSVWGFGDMGVLRYTVKAATQRLLHRKCSSLPGWVPALGMRPRLWRDQEGALAPAAALREQEARHKRKFAELLQQGFRSGSSSSRFSQADQEAAVHANWMDPSLPRMHPRQRAAAAAAAATSAITAQRQQQLLLQVEAPAMDDTVDPLLRGMQEADAGDAAWRAAYRHARDKRIPRQLRVFGWRLLHAAVKVGGSRVCHATSQQELLECCCRQQQCRPTPPAQDQQQQQQQQQQQHHRHHNHQQHHHQHHQHHLRPSERPLMRLAMVHEAASDSCRQNISG
jgi:hypothetical protein